MTEAAATAATLHPETADAIKAAVRLGLESLRAEPPQRLGDWARDHFKLAGESSHTKGAWLAWAFQVGILDFMSDDRIEELDVMKAKRVGYTKMVTAYVAYNVAHRRRKQALWQPTDDDRDSYVKSEIDPVLDPATGVPAVNKARRIGKGASEETIKYKPFRDSALHLLGGKASRAYRRITVAVAILDEISKFDRSIEKSGPPRGLARGRLEGAPYPKLVCGSTPLLKGLCHIEDAVEEAEGLVRFHIECKHCGAEHPLLWGGKDKAHGFKWERGQPATVRHVCPHCRASTTQADYMPGGTPVGGAWVCERTGKRYGPDRVWRDTAGMPCRPPRSLGVHVWTAYSPQRAWSDIVTEFENSLKALEKGDVGPMQLFVNETLGETWEMAGERTDEHALQARAEPYQLCTVPRGALMLTAGVDVQRNRWEITVYGWGRGLESWVVDVAVLEGNPAVDEEWGAVLEYLQRRYPQECGGGLTMGISATSIDSSDQTQAVYNWVGKAQHMLKNLRAIKGDGNDNTPILGPSSLQEINWRGKKVVRGIKLWRVGVDAAKDLLLGQLSIAQPGPGYVHFSDELPREFYEQLTAEQRVLARVNGREAYRWIKRRPRNEQLDTRNYALHAALGLGLHKYTDAQWQRLEAMVQPPADLFSAPSAQSASASSPQSHSNPAAQAASASTAVRGRRARFVVQKV
ncbi:phage terminase large subunit family protein [Comamonas aquatica]|uniref:phage terminase large subunit family protein n=1 Tax=Comamonas aquatica TaxID=225991 RepID=UPI0021B15693|nr:phage terminase large subunit family protein [Comamonas aquatica]MDH1900886.1 phage terminase large subunit family protein [Comamonas aquatica]